MVEDYNEIGDSVWDTKAFWYKHRDCFSGWSGMACEQTFRINPTDVTYTANKISSKPQITGNVVNVVEHVSYTLNEML